MHSLRHLGIPTVAIVFLITLSILALVGISEGFRLLVRRELQNDQRELQKRSGSTLRFTFPWDWQPPEATATPIPDAKDIVFTQVTSSSDTTAPSTAAVLAGSSSVPISGPSLAIGVIPVSIPAPVLCSTCSTTLSAQISNVPAITELCRNNTNPSASALQGVITTQIPTPISALGTCPSETWYRTISACTFTSISFVAAMTITQSCGAAATTTVPNLPSEGCSSTPTTIHPCPNAGYSCAECPDGWFCPPIQTSARNCPCGYGWPCVDCVQGWYCIPGPTSSAIAIPSTLVSAINTAGLGSAISSVLNFSSSTAVASAVLPVSSGPINTLPKASVQCRDGSFVYSPEECLVLTSAVAAASINTIRVGATGSGVNLNTATTTSVPMALVTFSIGGSSAAIAASINTIGVGATVSGVNPNTVTTSVPVALVTFSVGGSSAVVAASINTIGVGATVSRINLDTATLSVTSSVGDSSAVVAASINTIGVGATVSGINLDTATLSVTSSVGDSSAVVAASINTIGVGATVSGINLNTATPSVTSSVGDSTAAAAATISTLGVGFTLSSLHLSAAATSLATAASEGIGLSSTNTNAPTITNIPALTTGLPSSTPGDLSSMIGSVLASNTCGGVIPCLISEIAALAGQVGGQATSILVGLEGSVVSAGQALVTGVIGGLPLPADEALVTSALVGLEGSVVSAGQALVTGVIGELSLPAGESLVTSALVGLEGSVVSAGQALVTGVIGELSLPAGESLVTSALVGLEGSVVSAGQALVTGIIGGLSLPTGGVSPINSVVGGILGQLASVLAGDFGPTVSAKGNVGPSVVPQITGVSSAVAGIPSQVGTITGNVASSIFNAGAFLSQVPGVVPVTSIGVQPRATSSAVTNSILPQTIHNVGAPVGGSVAIPQATTTPAALLNAAASLALEILAATTPSQAQISADVSIGRRRVKRRAEAAKPSSEPIYGWGSDLSKCHEGPQGYECAPLESNQRHY